MHISCLQGPPGVGTSTLARVLYEELLKQHRQYLHCFLELSNQTMGASLEARQRLLLDVIESSYLKGGGSGAGGGKPVGSAADLDAALCEAVRRCGPRRRPLLLALDGLEALRDRAEMDRLLCLAYLPPGSRFILTCAEDRADEFFGAEADGTGADAVVFGPTWCSRWRSRTMTSCSATMPD